MRKVPWILSVTLLLVTGVIGLRNARDDWNDPLTALQRTVIVGVALYGMLGIVGGVGLARRRPWSVTVAAAWAITVTYAATVASFAFNDPTFSREGTLAGVVGAFVACALIGVFVVWSARRAVAARATGAPADAGTRSLRSG
jgi:hypothetical protein